MELLLLLCILGSPNQFIYYKMIGLANSETKNHIEIYLKIEICVRFVVWQELKLEHKSVVLHRKSDSFENVHISKSPSNKSKPYEILCIPFQR